MLQRRTVILRGLQRFHRRSVFVEIKRSARQQNEQRDGHCDLRQSLRLPRRGIERESGPFQFADQFIVGSKTPLRIGRDHPVDHADSSAPEFRRGHAETERMFF